MTKNRFYITVYKNGTLCGYVKSVSYTKCTFQITTMLSYAKGFATEDRVQAEIDTLTRFAYNQGYVFMYDWK